MAYTTSKHQSNPAISKYCYYANNARGKEAQRRKLIGFTSYNVTKSFSPVKQA